MNSFYQTRIDFDEIESRAPLQLMTVDEIYDGASEALLREIAEDNRIERKCSGEHVASVGEYLSMWSNTAPDGGLIVVGMENDGSFDGCAQWDDARLNNMEKVGKTHCHDAAYQTKRVAVTNKRGEPDFVLLFRVQYRDNKVVETCSGEAFHRLGDSKYLLSEDEKRELAGDKGQVSLELEPCGLKYPDEFATDAIHLFAANVRKHRNTGGDVTDTQVLEHRRLGTTRHGEFIPNVACALLFAKDPNRVVSGCAIRFLKYQGDVAETGEKRNVIKDISIEGRVPDLIVEADKVIRSQVREFATLGKDGKFYSELEYPETAWYEAIVNACVHRSYSLKGMNIFVRMFDNRIVIESPGGFMPFVNADNIYDIHVRRNYWLMDAMFYLEFVRCENEGAKRIRKAMLDRGLPAPEFEQKKNNSPFVRVTLRNNVKGRVGWVDKDASDLIGESIFGSLDPHSRRIINFVAEHKRINISQAMRLIQKRWHTTKKLLMSLVERGILCHVSKFSRDCNAHFVLCNKRSDQSEK